MFNFGIFDGVWVASNALELSSLLIASIALLYAARAFHLTKRTSRAALHSENSDLKLRAKTALADATRSLEHLYGRCHDIQSQWDAHNHKQNFMKLGRSFHKDPEVIGNSRVQQQGVSMLTSLEDGFSDLDALSRRDLEKRLIEAKHVAIEIEGLARQLQGPPAPLF